MRVFCRDFLAPLHSSPVNFGGFTINFQRVSLIALRGSATCDDQARAGRVCSPLIHKLEDEINRSIDALKVLMQILTFAQFGALLYTILRTQWHKRHETATKFKNLKKRASSVGGRLRSLSSRGGKKKRGDEMEAATAASGNEDGAAHGEGEAGGSGGSGGNGGNRREVELQAMTRSASTEMDDNTRIVWKRNPSIGQIPKSMNAAPGENQGTSIGTSMAMHETV